MENIIIYGTGGHAKVITDIIEHYRDQYQIFGFITNDQQIKEEFLGYPVFHDDNILLANGIKSGIVAIGDNWSRALIVARLKNLLPDFRFITACHPSAQIAADIVIGQGTTIMAGTVINSHSNIGEHCIVNTKASIDHDCIIGNFSTIAPGACLGGRVKLGYMSTIALGANVIHNIAIGDHALIGAGSTVLSDIPNHSVAYGTPARCIRTRAENEPYIK